MAEQPAAVVCKIARARSATLSSLRVSALTSGSGSSVSCEALHSLHALGGDICRVKEAKVRKPIPTWALLDTLLAAERVGDLLRDVDVAVFIEGGEDLEFLVEAIETCCLGDCVYALRAFLCAEMTLDF